MTFPSWIEFIKHYNAGLLTGPILLGIAIWAGYKKISYGVSIKAKTSLAKYPPSIWLIIGCLVIGAVHFVGVYASLINAWHFRDMQPLQISEIKVERMIEEGKPDSIQPIVISDTTLIAEGLSKLTKAKNRDREHEYFINGYRIQLITSIKKDFYISVYEKSNTSGCGGVIPHIGREGAGSIHNAGEYNSPEFQEWVFSNIAPLFHKRT